MAQYNITATSAKREMTVSGTNTKKFPTPAEFADQAAADTQAAKYAKRLNHEDHEGVCDWVGQATAV
jgi:hypothetical protein